MSAPDRIQKLIETFDYNLEAYRKGSYNETQVRREFIDPFFEELGWDVANKQGHAEAYKDVIHEDAIKVGGVTKAPDYCFRVSGARKFFLEVKSGGQVDAVELFSLRAFTEEYAPKRAIVVGTEPRARKVGAIEILPWREFLKQLWQGML